MKTTSNARLYKAVRLVIYNLSENEELQKKMNAYGFTPKRVQEGDNLLENMRAMDTTQGQHYNQARKISYQIEQDNQAALEVFRDHVAIAKSAFRREPLVIHDLKIKKISGSKWVWTQQAIAFYSKAPEYMEKLQQYGATQESFEQNKAAAEALLALDAQRMKKKGDAENSTQVKKQTIKELKAWYGEFRKLARIAFRETPQILETFGMVVPSTRKKRKEISPVEVFEEQA